MSESYLTEWEKLNIETDRLEQEANHTRPYTEEYRQFLSKCIELEEKKLAILTQEINRIS